MRNVLVTGANGFIGRALCDKFIADGCRVRRAVRGRLGAGDWKEETGGGRPERGRPEEGEGKEGEGRRETGEGGTERGYRRAESGERVVVGDIGPGTDWTEALNGIDAVVHLAARVHV